MNKIKLIAVISAMVMSFVFAGCQVESDSHEHSFSKEWTSDETSHWHAATCEHTEEVSDKAEHTFGEWKTTLEPTEEADGKKERTCTVCSYKEEQSIAKLEHTHTFAETWTSDEANHWHVATCEHTEEVSGKAAHTFGEWEVTKNATCTEKGSRECTCTVCKYEETEEIAATGHSYSLEWSKDLTNHWHAATCEHTEEVSEKAAHTFGDYVSNNDATTESDGTKTRKCSVCGYQDTVTDAGSKIETVATPTFSVESGEVISGTSVTITCATEGAKIYYTKDGSEPTASGTEYTEAISITEVVTLKAIAVKSGMSNSTVASVSYRIIPEGFVKVTGTTITGKENWTPSSEVFVSGRQITIPDMYVCDHEVTQAEYEKYCKYGSSSPSSSYGDGDNYPAYYVNWYDAIVYCNLRSIAEDLTPAYKIGEETDPAQWSGIVGDATNGYCGPSSSDSTWNALTYDKTADGYRLPTEAEWEYIAREAGTSSTTYSGSNTIGDVAWYSSNSDSKTHEVKGKNANSLGIYDMSGNVWEWCYDWYSSITSTTADTGASSGSYRVQRGGSWYDYDSYCRVSHRDYGSPNYRGFNYGFRVVRSRSK